MENINNKPLSVALTDIKKDIVKTINEAQLHPVLIKMILDELCDEINKTVAYTTQIENEQYQQQQAQLQEENE